MEWGCETAAMISGMKNKEKTLTESQENLNLISLSPGAQEHSLLRAPWGSLTIAICKS